MQSDTSSASPAKITNVIGNAKVNGEAILSQYALESNNDLFVEENSSLDLSVDTGLALNDLFRLNNGSASVRFGTVNPAGNIANLNSNESSINYNKLYIELKNGTLYSATAKRDFFRKEILSFSTENVSIVNQFDANFSIEKNDNGTQISVHQGNVSFTVNNQTTPQTLNAKSSVLITPNLLIEQRTYVLSNSETEFFEN